MRSCASIGISAPPDAVWDFVADPRRYLHFMAGITRWEVAGERRDGIGARYRMLMRVGSAEVGGLVEVVEHEPARELAWTSVTGIDQRGRWRLRAQADGDTQVQLRISYGVAGSGLLGWLAERVAQPQVAGNLRRTLLQLKRQVEHEQSRRRAAERRAARAGAAS
jgi:uncharacterized membrane protein